MSLRIEWRSKAEGDDSLLAVEEESDTVVGAWEANPSNLRDFLNDMEDPGPRNPGNTANAQPDPEEWGALVIARRPDGDILVVDPQLYWEGIAFWFRARGDDPHPWRPNN